MSISDAFRKAFGVYFGHFGTVVKFLAVELCMTLAALTPLLFLTNRSLQLPALLAVPFWLLLVPWARVNAAAAMRDAVNGGSLFGYGLVETEGYGKKLVYGLTRCGLLLIWAVPMIASLIIAKIHIAGEMDAFTMLRLIKQFGGGDLMTGAKYLLWIFMGTLVLLAIGCAFHSGDRHVYVHGKKGLLKGWRGGIVLCWVCALATLLPLIAALVVLVFRYLPSFRDLAGVLTGTSSLPDSKTSLLIFGVGAVLTIPLLPLRSLITAAYVDGLEKGIGRN